MSTPPKKTTTPKPRAKAAPSKATQPAASTAPAASVTPTPAPIPETPTITNRPQPVILGPVMRKKELFDLVVERSGIKKRDAKPVVEAMLGILGEALAEGRELVMPPLGRVKGHKEKVMAKKRMMIVKIHQNIQPTVVNDPTEDDAEF